MKVAAAFTTLACACLLALAAPPAAGRGVNGQDARTLPTGETVERRLGEGEGHLYTVKLKRGQSLRVDLTERGIDCVLSVISRKETGGVNFGKGFGRETFTYVSKDGGEYVVAVTAPVSEYVAIARLIVRDKGRAGAYSLTATINPGHVRAEQQRAQAVQVLSEAQRDWNPTGGGKAEALIRRLEVSFKIWQELKEDYWAGYVADRLGVLHFNAGRAQQAVEHLELALGLFRKAGDKRGQVTVNSNLGSVYGTLRRPADALKFHLEALALSEETGGGVETALSLSLAGQEYANLGSKQTAIEYLERALLVLKDFGDSRVESGVRANLGVLYARTGEVERAAASLNRALALAKRTQDITLEARVLDDTADFYSQVGEFQRALEYGTRALSLFQKSDNRHGQARVYSNLGEFHQALGELREAQTYFRKAVAIYKGLGDEGLTAGALGKLTETYRETGDVPGAAQSLRDARELLKGRESEQPLVHAALLIEEGHAHAGRGDDEAARASYEEAVRVARSVGYQNYEGAALSGLARLYLRRGDRQAAMLTNTRALVAATSYNDPTMEAWALTSLMESWGMLGNLPLAIFYGKEAVNKYQGLRAHIRGLDGATQKSFVRKQAAPYIGLAYLLLHRGRHAEALQVINAFRDQQFYDFDRDPNAPATPLTLTPREAALSSTQRRMIEEGVTANRRLAEFRRRAGARPSPEQAAEITRLAENLDKSGEEFGRVISKAAADFSRTTPEDEASAPVEDLKEMQGILRELSAATGQKTVAVYTLDGGGIVFLLLVTPDSVTAAPSVVGDNFDDKVLQYYALLQTPALDPRPLGRELYGLVVKPLEPALRAAGAQTILWSPGGTLRYVPMASLWDGERYLAERFRNVVFTRADPERMTRAVGRTWTGTGFGSSRAHTVEVQGDGRVSFLALPGVTRELESIFRTGGGDAGILEGEVVSDRRFTRDAFYESLKRRRPLVHVASHFSFRPGDGSRSYLLMGDSTVLTLDDMKGQGRLFEGVELLTLSACNTAATLADAGGREIDGFAELAQRLGAGSVMATLWQVSDSSTPWLMKKFYADREAGRTKAEALRNAQLELLNGTADTEVFEGGGRGGRPPNVRVLVTPSRPAAPRPQRRPAPPAARLAASRAPSNQSPGPTRADIVFVEARNAPPFKADGRRPFAHPYYWSPFVLYGNGR